LAATSQPGTQSHDILTGNALANNIVGGLDDDTLINNGGHDVFYGAAGDDVIAISDLNFNRIDGGRGKDILCLDGGGLALDLTTIANNRISGIEQMAITASGNNSLTLNRLDVLTLSDETSQLIGCGNTGDILVGCQERIDR
jgi:Ca2+-binding RTX toxin-like protein